MELFRHIEDRITELRTYGRTELFLKSLSRLKTSLKWLTVAMPLLETNERLERDKKETRERQERDEAMADGLT